MLDLIGLIGVLDLPTHTIGRQTSHLKIWKTRCCHQHGIEEGLGLPHSLVDLLASIAESDTEEQLLQWKYESDDQIQQQIWQAARHAGILSVRELRVNNPFHYFDGLYSAQQHTGPATADIQRALLSTLQGLQEKMKDETFTGRQTLLFPLVMAGSQHSLLTANDQSFIRNSMNALACNNLTLDQYYGTTYKVLESFWASDGQKTFDQTVRDMGLELGIF